MAIGACSCSVNVADAENRVQIPQWPPGTSSPLMFYRQPDRSGTIEALIVVTIQVAELTSRRNACLFASHVVNSCQD